jgi:hypothetical protein
MLSTLPGRRLRLIFLGNRAAFLKIVRRIEMISLENRWNIAGGEGSWLTLKSMVGSILRDYCCDTGRRGCVLCWVS